MLLDNLKYLKIIKTPTKTRQLSSVKIPGISIIMQIKYEGQKKKTREQRHKKGNIAKINSL